MDLSHLKPAAGATKNRKRLGRGPGSGQGKTAGRGHKGEGSRSGSTLSPGYEGGQMPLARRLPKRGFANRFRREVRTVNVGALSRFEAGAEVDAAALAAAGLVPSATEPVKLLGEGDVKVALKVSVNAASGGARAKIEAAGGSVELVPPRASGEAATP